MYTTLLSRVADTKSEQSHYWALNGGKHELVTIVSGGGGYRHELWDYSGDTIVSHHNGYSTFFSIEKFNTSPNKGIVLLLPIVRYKERCCLTRMVRRTISMFSEK